MKQILCLANEPWSTVLPSRTQQLISRLRDAQILYFYPAQSTRDRSYLKGVRQVRPNVAVCALPPDRRTAVTLFYYESMTVDEIARLLGVPQGTVKSRLARARAQLKEMLQEQEGDYEQI